MLTFRTRNKPILAERQGTAHCIISRNFQLLENMASLLVT
jgi:hypothetical protein